MSSIMTAELALLVGGAIVADFVQGLSGFAFNKVAMSFWVWGIEPSVAALMAVVGSYPGVRGAERSCISQAGVVAAEFVGAGDAR